MTGTMSSEFSLTEHRSKFPALKNKSYLNFGAQGTMPVSAIDAIKDSYLYVQENGPLSFRMFQWIVDEGKKIKSLLAEEFGGDMESYALTQNATEGCNIVLWGLDWKAGDILLTSDSEHNGVMKAAMQLCKRKNLKLQYCDLQDKQSEEEILETVAEALKSKPKLFMISHVLWNTGKVLPAKEISKLCREAGVKLLIDGAQSAGVLPLNLMEINADYYACTGHKWLCGPEGIGFLHVNPGSLEELEPTFVGWRGAIFNAHGQAIDWAPAAARFEVATAPFPLLSGLRESIKLHRQAGTAEDRYKLILEKTQQLRRRLASVAGLRFLDESGGSSLVSFAIEGARHFELVKKLDAERIIVRTIPGPDCIRASVHYFTSEEIDKFAESLIAYCRSV